MKYSTLLIGAMIVGSSLQACGDKKESATRSFGSYQFTSNGCDTGTHEYNTREELCAKLADDSLNRGCAAGLRKSSFEENCSARGSSHLPQMIGGAEGRANPAPEERTGFQVKAMLTPESQMTETASSEGQSADLYLRFHVKDFQSDFGPVPFGRRLILEYANAEIVGLARGCRDYLSVKIESLSSDKLVGDLQISSKPSPRDCLSEMRRIFVEGVQIRFTRALYASDRGGDSAPADVTLSLIPYPARSDR